MLVRIGSMLPEITSPTDIDLPDGAKLTLEPLTRKGNRLLVGDFDPEDYENEYRNELRAMLEAKLDGKEIAKPEPVAVDAPVVDLMEALKQSVAQAQKDKSKSAAKPKKAASGRKRAAARG